MNPRVEMTAFLLKEEERLIKLLDRLKPFKHLKRAAKARAANTLACVQRELNQRGV